MNQEPNPKLKALKEEASHENIDISHCADSIPCIEETIASVRRDRSPTPRNPKDIYRGFHKWSERLKFVTVENMSFEKLIATYDKPDAFFYCDPPYVSTESYYQNTGGFGEKEHRKLAEVLHNIDGKFLLSYNDCELVRELYGDMNIRSTKEIEYTLRGAGSKKKVREVFVSNY